MAECKIIYDGKKYTDDEFLKYIRDNALSINQLKDKVAEKVASPKTIASIKEFLSRIGAKVEGVEDIVVNGRKLNATGLVVPLKGLIQVVNGHENVVLPEEAMHIATELTQQLNPSLFASLMSDVNKYPELPEAFAEYRTNKLYQTPDGKPDVIKLKKEAIAKILAKIVNDKVTESDNPQSISKTRTLWQRIVDWLKKLFGKAGFDPFEDLAKKVVSGEDIGKVSDIKGEPDTFLHINRDETFDKIETLNEKVAKNGSEYTINGEKISQSVDNDVARDLEKKYKSPSDYQEALNDWRKQTEGKIQTQMTDIAKKYIGDDGLKRTEISTNVVPNTIDPYGSDTFTDTLDKWFGEKVNTYPPGTKFLINKNLFNSVQDKAGRANFIALVPMEDGTVKVDINQYKLLTSGKRDTDISQKMQDSYNLEIQGLRDILSKSYAIKRDDFRETRVIPIKAVYEENEESGDFELESLKIGNAYVELEKDLTLLPVPSLSESTGNKTLDALISKFKASADALSRQKPVAGQELIKKRRVAELYAAIRTLQIKKNATDLIKSAKNITDYEENRLPTLDKKVKETDALAAGIAGLKKLLDEIHMSQSRLAPYADLGNSMRTIYGPKDADGFVDSAKAVSSSAVDSITDLNILEDYVRTNLLSKITNIRDDLKMEKKLNWWNKTFMGISHGDIKSQGHMWDLANKIENYHEFEYGNLLDKLREIQKDIDKAGISDETVRTKILEHDDKGNWTGKAVQKIDKSFNETINKAIKEKSIDKIKDSIDLDAYKKWYDGGLAGIEEYSKNATFADDPEANSKAKYFAVQNWKDLHNINSKTGINGNNRGLFKFPKQGKWESPAYNELKKIPSLLALHNFLEDLVDRANTAGMFEEYYQKYGFFPQMSKGFIEKVASKGGFKEGYIAPWRGLTTTPEGQAIGEFDPVSNEPINRIRAHYVRDLGKRVQNTDGTWFSDYAGVSQQVVKALNLFAGDVVKYELRSEMEPLFNMLVNTEGRKPILRGTKKKGEEGDKGEDQPAPNIDNLEAMIKYRDFYMYDKLLSGADFTVDMNVGKPIKRFNKFMGRKILVEPETDIVTISGNKILGKLGRYFNTKTMAFSFLGPIANIFGGTTNAYINSGQHFDKTDFLKSTVNLPDAIGGFTEEGHLRAALLHFFNPENQTADRNKPRNFSDYKAEKYLTSDSLHILMRASDEMVNNTVALAFFDNTLLQDGKLINIREKVKAENNWDKRYDLPPEERKALEKKIEKDIDDLKANSPDLLLKKARLDDKGFLVLDISKDEYSKYRTLMLNFSKGILGNMSTKDLALYRTHIIGALGMMFKNWIPELANKRIGNLKFNYGTGRWEYGRTRGLVSHMAEFGLSGVGAIFQALGGQKEPFIAQARRDYERRKQRAADRNEDFDISFADFVDLKLKAATSGFKEILMALSVLGMYYFIKSLAKDDKDKDHVRQGLYKFTLRGIDKLQDEISFFYNPTSFTSIVNGNVIPAISLATDAEKLLKNIALLGYYEIVGDDQGIKNTHVMKYIYKDVPVLKEWMNYQAIWSKKFAEDNGIILQTQSGGH